MFGSGRYSQKMFLFVPSTRNVPKCYVFALISTIITNFLGRGMFFFHLESSPVIYKIIKFNESYIILNLRLLITASFNTVLTIKTGFGDETQTQTVSSVSSNSVS